MKFQISSKQLEGALSSVIGVVPNKATLPILETVLFEADDKGLTLTATDLEITVNRTIDADIQAEGSVAIPGRRLLETLRQLADIPVGFDVDGSNHITFKTDKGTYKLVGENGDEFPSAPELSEGSSFSVPAEVLKDSIHRTSFAVSNDDLRPAMMGVFFQVSGTDAKIVATDGHRLVKLIRKDITTEKEAKFIVPEKALSMVGKSELGQTAKVTIFQDHARFEGSTTSILTRLINETYPNYESVIPRENDKILRVDKNEMLSTVKRVSIFSSSTTRQVRLEMHADALTISAEDIDMSSEAKESIPCEYNAENMVIGFNARYLSDVLNNIDQDEVEFEFSTPNRAGIVKPVQSDENQEMIMLVMPVMLNSYS